MVFAKKYVSILNHLDEEDSSTFSSLAETFASNTDVAIVVLVAFVFLIQIAVFVVLFRLRGTLQNIHPRVCCYDTS